MTENYYASLCDLTKVFTIISLSALSFAEVYSLLKQSHAYLKQKRSMNETISSTKKILKLITANIVNGNIYEQTLSARHNYKYLTHMI